jgi:hypothetical protein
MTTGVGGHDHEVRGKGLRLGEAEGSETFCEERSGPILLNREQSNFYARHTP